MWPAGGKYRRVMENNRTEMPRGPWLSIELGSLYLIQSNMAVLMGLSGPLTITSEFWK